MRLQHPVSGKIQQGAVFNCVRVQGYENCECYGIVLTARCDLAHAKSNLINYLPVVRFSDWARRDMCFLLARRLQSEVTKSINALLDRKLVSREVRATFPLKDIITKETTGEDQVAALQKYAHYESIKQALALGGSHFPDGKAMFSISPKASETLMKELIAQKLGEYYFLDAADCYAKEGEGYIVLLRSMQTITMALMSRIAEGLEQNGPMADPQAAAPGPLAPVESLLGPMFSPADSAASPASPPSGEGGPAASSQGPVAHPESASPLTFTHQPICMITGVLRSPDIEHLAQQFSNLFVRIGLTDHDDKLLHLHLGIAKNL